MASQVPSLLTLTKLRLILGFRVSKVPGTGSTYLLTRCCSGQSDAKSRINQTIDKDSPKVVHSFNVEDIRNKAVYCRCWRSKKFPYCDGSHGKHNAETGDNVGPLIIKRTTPE